MSTLAVVEEILRETATPMSVKEIVDRAGSRLPSKSKTPDTVVARDLSMDIKKKGDGSLFVRTSPGRYTLRDLIRTGDADHVATQARSSAPSTTSSEANVLSPIRAGDRAAPLPARDPLPAAAPRKATQPGEREVSSR